MGRGQGNERIVLPCKFGTLVREVVRNDDDYKELAIDLYRDDGKASQIAVIGTNEYEGNDDNMVHAYLWDGEDDEYRHLWHMDPFGDGYWGEETL